MSLSAEEKRRFLKALEEDQEFRLAVAGLLGLGEVLAELKKLREDFSNYVKKSERRWRRNEKRWEEANKRFSRLDEMLGAVAESRHSRYVWEDLRGDKDEGGRSAQS